MATTKLPHNPGQQQTFNKEVLSKLDDLLNRVTTLEDNEEANEQVYADWAMIALDAAQTSNISVSNHIEFDLIAARSDTNITLATGSGQSDGLITLPADKQFLIVLFVHAYMNEGYFRVQLFDHTLGAAIIGDTGEDAAIDLFVSDPVALDGGSGSTSVLFTPATSTQIKAEFVTVSNASSIRQGTRLWIQEIL